MGLSILDVLAELKVVADEPQLKPEHIQEWSTGTVTPQAGEWVYFLPVLGINVAVKFP